MIFISKTKNRLEFLREKLNMPKKYTKTEVYGAFWGRLHALKIKTRYAPYYDYDFKKLSDYEFSALAANAFLYPNRNKNESEK